MKTCAKFILKMLVLAAIATGCAERQKDENNDEAAIKTAVKAYQDAFNRQDADKLASMWTSDGVLSNPLIGTTAEGREAIAKMFRERFAQEKNRKVEIQVKSIEFPAEDEALENGVMKITAPDEPERRVAYEVGYVKEQGQWLIDEIKEIDLQEAPSNFENLKELAWMEGKWVDEDEDVEISFDCKWDKYKNFLTQNFSMKILGNDAIEGRQIIAWDPVEEKIRSWVFDSDGGFGEGTWEKLDKSWYASMKYTLSDGTLAYAKNVYTPIDDRSYTFASVERESDGDLLPNLDPVKVEKVE